MQCPSCSLISMLVRKDPESTPCAPNAGMRCGLPASSRQCGRCLGWSSTYAEAADTSEPPNASRSPTTEVASTDARRTNFPVSCRHSRTPIIRHGRPAKDEADLSSLRGAHEARQAIALARPQTPSDPPVSVHRLRACRHGRVARVRRRGAVNELLDSLGAGVNGRAHPSRHAPTPGHEPGDNYSRSCMMLRADLMPAGDLRHNRPRRKRFRDDPPLVRVTPPSPATNATANLDPPTRRGSASTYGWWISPAGRGLSDRPLGLCERSPA